MKKRKKQKAPLRNKQGVEQICKTKNDKFEILQKLSLLSVALGNFADFLMRFM
jgi:hypothetical protein